MRKHTGCFNLVFIYRPPQPACTHVITNTEKPWLTVLSSAILHTVIMPPKKGSTHHLRQTEGATTEKLRYGNDNFLRRQPQILLSDCLLLLLPFYDYKCYITRTETENIFPSTIQSNLCKGITVSSISSLSLLGRNMILCL